MLHSGMCTDASTSANGLLSVVLKGFALGALFGIASCRCEPPAEEVAAAPAAPEVDVEAACRAGDQRRCVEQAHRLLADGERAEALGLLGATCDAGEATGCRRLGWAHLDPGDPDAKPYLAARAFSVACAGGLPDTCEALARLHVRGHGAPPDMVKAAALRRVACEADHLPACAELAWQHVRGQGAAKSEEKAAALFQKCCDGGMTELCDRAGQPMRSGKADASAGSASPGASDR